MKTEEWRRIAGAATPGPWDRLYVGGNYAEQVTATKPKGGTLVIARIASGFKQREHDATHIAASHPARVLAAIKVIEAARAMADRMVTTTKFADKLVENFDAALAELEALP